MSKYTTEVRFICETAAGFEESQGYGKVDEIIGLAVPHIFDFEFPIFDEEHRPELCKKILKHYYTREIGAETVGLWKLWLNTRMNEIMPYYNEMYKTAAIEYDPTHNVNLSTTHEGEDTRTGRKDYMDDGQVQDSNSANDTVTNTRGVTGSTLSKFSDTPQGMLQGVESGQYLTNATLNENEQTITDTNTKVLQENNLRQTHADGFVTDSASNTDSWTDIVKGKTGSDSISKMIMEYRKAVLNVDMMIVDELKDLFLNLW